MGHHRQSEQPLRAAHEKAGFHTKGGSGFEHCVLSVDRLWWGYCAQLEAVQHGDIGKAHSEPRHMLASTPARSLSRPHKPQLGESLFQMAPAGLRAWMLHE